MTMASEAKIERGKKAFRKSFSKDELENIFSDRLCELTPPYDNKKDSFYPQDKFNEIVNLAINEYTKPENNLSVDKCIYRAIRDYEEIMKDCIKLFNEPEERDM